MAQNYIQMKTIGASSWTTIKQPVENMGYSFETTYTADTTRVQSGALHASSMFTVEQLSYSAKNLTISEMSAILQIIAKGTPFSLHYFSPYYGTWRDDTFYVGQGSLNIGRLKEDKERFESLSFNMTGVNPI